jgi:hypothetical protein
MINVFVFGYVGREGWMSKIEQKRKKSSQNRGQKMHSQPVQWLAKAMQPYEDQVPETDLSEEEQYEDEEYGEYEDYDAPQVGDAIMIAGEVRSYLSRNILVL